MKMFIKFFTCIILCIASLNLNAQSIFIQNMTIVPPNPTIQDSVMLIVEASFSSGPCGQVVLYPTIIGNFISIQAGHNLGPLAYICTSIDTINLGTLSVGAYSLQYNITAGASQVSDSLTFIVSTTPGIQTIDSKWVKAYFNRSSSQIVIESKNKSRMKIRLNDANGKNLKYFTFLDDRNEIKIMASHIPNGLYILLIEFENQIVSQKLLIHH